MSRNAGKAEAGFSRPEAGGVRERIKARVAAGREVRVMETFGIR